MSVEFNISSLSASQHREQMALVMERANAHREKRPLPLHQPGEETLGEIDERFLNHTVWAFGAFKDGRQTDLAGFVLGFSSIEYDKTPRDPDIEYLSLLMIDPDYQRRGIGSSLLLMAKSKAIELGRSSMTLWTGEGNQGARDFYERHNYKLVDGEVRFSERQGRLVRYILHL